MTEYKKLLSKLLLLVVNKFSVKTVFALVIVFAVWGHFLYSNRQFPLPEVNPSQAAISEISSLSNKAPLVLFAQPDTGYKKIEEFINNAQHSVDLVIYELDDRAIEQALVNAQKRGVLVRVILENVNTFGKHPNQSAYDFLKNNQVPIKWAPEYFTLTHQKTLIVDNQFAVVMTFNLVSRYYDSSRDFAIIDSEAKDITAIKKAFESDWNGQRIPATQGNNLVWSPGASEVLLELINSATTSLDIYSLLMSEPRITDALKKASQRGILVRVIMTYATSWKDALSELSDAGVIVKTYASSADKFIHAKVIIADSAKVFVGSQNFSTQSLEGNRELGVLISREDIISSLESTFISDWNEARPFVSSSQKKSTDTFIKLSKSGICHSPDSSSYSQTKSFTAYATLEECLSAGGKLPASKNKN